LTWIKDPSGLRWKHLSAAVCYLVATLDKALEALPAAARTSLLKPAIMVPPLLWLLSPQADGVTGRRFIASQWRDDDPLAAAEDAGWASKNVEEGR
jgi:hypothetical protein